MRSFGSRVTIFTASRVSAATTPLQPPRSPIDDGQATQSLSEIVNAGIISNRRIAKTYARLANA